MLSVKEGMDFYAKYRKVLPEYSYDQDIASLIPHVHESPYFKEVNKRDIKSIGEVVILLHSVYGWADSGFPVFKLTPSTLSRLVLTDPSSVDFSMVKPPFFTFVVQVPYGFWKIPFEGTYDPYGDMDSTEDNDLVSITYHCYTSYSAKKLLKITPYPCMTTTFIGHNGLTLTQTDRFLVEGNVGTWINEKLVAEDEENSGASEYTKNTTTHLYRMGRIIYVNLCLYLKEFGLGRKERFSSLARLRKRGFKKGKGLQLKANVWNVESKVDIDIDEELIAAAKSCDNRKGWKLTVQKIVRGHWKRQHHGPKRSKVKVIHVEPYKKGPKDKELLRTAYTVK